MPKCNFYALCRYVDKTDGSAKCGYLPKEGYDVPNDLGIKLSVYKSVEQDICCLDKTVWHVTDVESGLEVGKGDTKKDAIHNAIKSLSMVGKERLEAQRRKIREQYGEMPGYRISWLHGKDLRDLI